MRRVHKSPITEHNKNRKTDQLYDPLRTTLRKSRSKSKLMASGVSSVTDFQGSVVSRRMHQIGPDQAERLEHQIYIPVDKALKPTGDHQKIQGHKFVAVDMNQKIGRPISESQFKRLKSRQGMVEETIYEFSSKQSSQKQTPIQAYGFIEGQKVNDPRRRSKYYSPDIYTTYTTNYKDAATNNNQNREPIVRLQRAQEQDRNGTNGGIIKRLSSRENSNRLSKNNQESEKQIDFNQILGEGKSKQYGRDSKANDNEEYRFRSGNYASKGVGSLNSGNPEGIKNGLSLSKNKSPYKYNLFSSIDEGVNTKCSSFGKNQIIAGRADKKQWV